MAGGAERAPAAEAGGEERTPAAEAGRPTSEGELLGFAVRELAGLIEIPSPHGDEARILEHLEGRLAALGYPPARVDAEGAGWNLLVGDGPPDLLLVAHVDTIRPTWEWEPVARVDGTRVSGLGAQDDKGGVAALLVALRLLAGEGLPRGVAVGFTVDEEWGGRGSRALARTLRPRHVVALEGTEGRVCIAEAGYLEAWVRVRGRGVHGSLVEAGDNAAVRAARFVLDLPGLPAAGLAPHPLLGPTLASVEELRAGGPIYAVPELGEVRVDVRVAPPASSERVLVELRELARRHGGEVEVIERAEPFEVPPDGELVRALRAAARRVTGAEAPLGGMPSWTDAHSFVEEAGAEAVVYGPGSLSRAHRPDEWIDAREVVTAGRVLADLARGWPATSDG
ncbi:MAG TPA: M20/M25/M40 family metallo-hydrolase [Actinomycetota bacterium]|nr:M20/M25/M40 family metallo-hydrolase [Actinomycetota bacterium]